MFGLDKVGGRGRSGLIMRVNASSFCVSICPFHSSKASACLYTAAILSYAPW